jgi:hypothetical protein
MKYCGGRVWAVDAAEVLGNFMQFIQLESVTVRGFLRKLAVFYAV